MCSFINYAPYSIWKIYFVTKAIFINGGTNIDTEVLRKVKARKIDIAPFQNILLQWIQEITVNQIQLTAVSWELFWVLAIETYKCCSCCPQLWKEYIKCMHLQTENVGLDKAQETKPLICTYSRNLCAGHKHLCSQVETQWPDNYQSGNNWQ